MTEDEFEKRAWRCYQLVKLRVSKTRNHEILCTVIVVDFERNLLKLEPVLGQLDHNGNEIEDTSFWASHDYVFPNYKLKKV